MAHLHDAHGPGIRIPLAEVGTRPASNLSPDPRPFRRPPVHHRSGLPAGADHPQAASRARRDRKLDHPAPHSRRPAACHRHVPPQGWQDPARAQGNAGRPLSCRSTLHSVSIRSRARLEDDRLITGTSLNGSECSADTRNPTCQAIENKHFLKTSVKLGLTGDATGTLVAHLQAQYGGAADRPDELAVYEAAAGLLGRSFATAEVQGDSAGWSTWMR